MSNEGEGLGYTRPTIPTQAEINSAKGQAPSEYPGLQEEGQRGSQKGSDGDDVTSDLRRAQDATTFQENDRIPRKQAQIGAEEVIGDPAQEVTQEEEKGLNPEEIKKYAALNIGFIKILKSRNLECPRDSIDDLLISNNRFKRETDRIGPNLDEINKELFILTGLLEKMGKKDMADYLRSFQSDLSNQYEELRLRVHKLVTNAPDSQTLHVILSSITENLRSLVEYNETLINGKVPDESEQEKEIRRSEEMSLRALRARRHTNEVIDSCNESMNYHTYIRNIILSLRRNVYRSDAYEIIANLNKNPKLNDSAFRLLQYLDAFAVELENLEYHRDKLSMKLVKLKNNCIDINGQGITYLRRYLDEYADLVRRTRKSST